MLRSEKKIKPLYIYIPLFCAIFFFVSLKLKINYFFFYILVSLIHFIRQQFGVLMCTLRNGRKMTKKEAYLNQIFFYNLMLSPIIYFCIHPKLTFEWIYKDFSFILSEQSAFIFLLFFFLMVLIQFLFEVREYLMFKTINIPKLTHSFFTFILWFFYPYINQSWAEATAALLIIQHAIFYLAFCYKRMVSTTSEKDETHAHRIIKKIGPFYSYVLLIVITFVFMNTLMKMKALTFVVIAVTLNHFILDGFIWKVRDLKTLAPR